MTQAEQLQDAIGTMRAGRPPLPLARQAAVEYARALRGRGYDYPAIGRVMADYHGQFYSASWWRKTIRRDARRAGDPDG